MKPRLKINQNGMTLIEVLVATAIMAIISVGMMSMLDNSNKATKSNQLTIEANDLDNRIQGYFLKSDYCKATLGGMTIAPNGQLPITEIKNATSTTLISSDPISPNNKIGNLLVKNMLLTRKAGGANEVELLVTFEKVNKTNSVGSETFKPRSVSIQAVFDIPTNPNKILTCYSNLDSAINEARKLSCLDLCPTCWNDTLKKCIFPASAKVYQDPITKNLTTSTTTSTTTQEHCDECSQVYQKTQCNPCPAGSQESNRECHWVSACGWKPWKERCTSTCTKTMNTIEFGNLIPFH